MYSAGYPSGALQSWGPKATSFWAWLGRKYRFHFLYFLHQHFSGAPGPHGYPPAVSDVWCDARGPSPCYYHPRLATIQDFAQQHGDPSEEGHRLDGGWCVCANCGQPLHVPLQGPHWRWLVKTTSFYDGKPNVRDVDGVFWRYTSWTCSCKIARTSPVQPLLQ